MTNSESLIKELSTYFTKNNYPSAAPNFLASYIYPYNFSKRLKLELLMEVNGNTKAYIIEPISFGYDSSQAWSLPRPPRTFVILGRLLGTTDDSSKYTSFGNSIRLAIVPTSTNIHIYDLVEIE